MNPMPRWWFSLLGGLCLALTACAGPVGTARVDPKIVLGNLGRSAVATGEPSMPTRNVLFEQGLFVAFDERPEAAIAELHRAMVASHGDQDLLFALAELSFLHGQAATKPDYSLAAAVYAYAFLFPENAGDAAPGRFDPRVRIAADLYNWALTRAFTSKDASEVVPRGGAFALPFGQIDVAFDPAALRAGDRELYRLIPVAELDIYGLQMRYRWPGLGAPLAASTRPIDASRPGRDMVAPRLQVPVTALLRIPDARRALVQGRPLTGTLEMHLAWDEESVSIAGEQVPLENEPSAALALTFTGVPTMELETLGLLGRLTGVLRDRPPLVSATPYRPGLIPVVFVHGTGSSLVRWAEMYNRLAADPEIRSRFQFWFFQYDSGNPIALSALRLREAVTAAVARLDPEGRDPALRQMILIGHSQGGLLVKMQAISTGDQLWNAVSNKPMEELQIFGPDPRSVPPRILPRAVARSDASDLHLHPPSRELRGRSAHPRQPHPAALDPALRPHRGGGRHQPEPGRREGRIRPVGGRQHVAGASVHHGLAGDPRRPVRQGQLHHRGRRGRGGRAGRRWRRQVLRRPHRTRRVRIGRALEPFCSGESRHHRGGAAHPSAARGLEDEHGAAGGPMIAATIESAVSCVARPGRPTSCRGSTGAFDRMLTLVADGGSTLAFDAAVLPG